MAVNDVQLTASMRANLLTLQNTDAKIAQKQNILSTGNKINSALDGPTAFFAAKSLNQRAGDLSSLKDSMGQAISTIKAADKGVTAIESLIEQARGLTTSAYSALGDDAASVATRKALADQFNTLKSQIDKIAGDSGYAGKNLLAGNGRRLDSTSDSRGKVNTLAGLGNARVTNVVSADTYSIRVSGDGSIEGESGDIADAETAHGLVGLKISGTMSATNGNFSDVSVEVRGAEGRLRSFIVSDGEESRTITYFDNTQSAEAKLTTAASATAQQVSEIEISGTIEEGDIFTVTVEGQQFKYIATSGDVATGQTATDNVAAQLQASISNAVTSPSGRLSGTSFDVATVSVATDTITITGKSPSNGTAREMTISATTTNALSKKISESFASGTVVSFTVDRKLMEDAANDGNGASIIEKKTDIQVSVTNLQGTTITRDGMNLRGEGKLANGEQAFSFDTGTVRLEVDQKTIKEGAASSASANIVTQQVTQSNTANDLSVQFNERNTNALKVAAQNLTTSGQGMRIDYAQNNWVDRSDIDTAVAQIDYAKSYLRSASQNLSTNLNIITTRESFTKEFSDVLTEGANKLTLADQNEEGASLLMLQTRQQLGTIALSLANQSQQAILRLF
ncbi:MAG TPA: flagellin [Azospirillaceae bacterium]|nr:flagellin [Azospirillaceae bacterium]HRQ79654.1 flagellin [Azospirillaceae bacterium]